jgi:D-hydroxyproline dehydrogenase subunit alpha
VTAPAWDVVVLGGGPAGIAAATTAAEAGCRVCVLDENPAVGGQIWRGYQAASAGREPHGREFAHWLERLKSAQVEIRSGTVVIAQPAAGALRVESATGWSDVRYKHLIVATGARERFLPFEGWTLPGVTGVGGLQALVKGGLPIAGKRVVLAGSGPLLLAVAAGLAKRGAQIAGIFEQAEWKELAKFGASLVRVPGKIAEGLSYRAATRSAAYRTGSWVVQAEGEGRLRQVTVAVGAEHRQIACDYLGCAFHLVPNLELPALLGCHINEGYVDVDKTQQSSVPGVYCVGELTGIGGLDKALVEGEIAGLTCAGRRAVHLLRERDGWVKFARRLDATFAPRREVRELAGPETFVCRCEDVRRSALAGMRNWREAKLHTRCGMGSCQGRICGPAVQALFGWEAASVRPPLMPARVRTLAAAPEAYVSPSA